MTKECHVIPPKLDMPLHIFTIIMRSKLINMHDYDIVGIVVCRTVLCGTLHITSSKASPQIKQGRRKHFFGGQAKNIMGTKRATKFSNLIIFMTMTSS